ncbi:hypothetical protein GCM10010435_39340 [Winogradskya consettensis]|uniref:Uncharacterized protein n=1 Tax=Winogradskya consettensis TaxID=113560 RepID=A0A919SBD5_9ACTN|nr:hypothetical protein [Actinoplanes consettensis]GIM69492.1 hypothetical protein Aco04nite_15470 [Actinoplanes consettensis]
MMLRVRQLDLVVTIAAAVAVGILGTFDVVSTAVTGGATLTMLGLLAVSSLHSRTTQQNLAGDVAELSRLTRQHLGGRDRLLAASTSGMDIDLSQAQDIRILGVTLGRTMRNHHATLQRRLDAGATVRIVLIAPDAAPLGEAARRSTVPERPEIFEHRLRPTVDLLDTLAVRAAAGPGTLQIRMLDFVPAFGMIAVDPETSHGHLHIDIYSHRNGAAEPALPLFAHRDARWFQHFTSDFDRIWSAGRPYGTGSAEGRGGDGQGGLCAGRAG